MIIHGYIPKRKKKKLNAKQRELKESWDNLLKKYPIKEIKTSPIKKTEIYRRETPHYPSLKTIVADTTKRTAPTYTGSEMIGIGTLHKSNAVPIFRKEDALDQANMRR